MESNPDKCPKCGFKRDPDTNECPRCGVVYDKYKGVIKKKEKRNICPHCNNSVLSTMKICPYCGQKLASGINQKFIGLIVVCVMCCFIYALVAVPGPKKSPSPKPPPPKEKQELTDSQKKQLKIEREKKRAEEYELCKQSLQCWGDKHSLKATYASQDLIEKFAKYDFKWTDGFWGSKMKKFGWLNKNKLTLFYLGDEIKFQNGFGAWQYQIYRVEYDPVNEKLLNVTVRPGRL